MILLEGRIKFLSQQPPDEPLADEQGIPFNRHKNEALRGLSPGQTHLKYKNPITTMVSATNQKSYFLIKILTQ